MAQDITTKQELKIGIMQNDMKHIVSTVERIEKLLVEHKATHEVMNKDVNSSIAANSKLIAGHDFWIGAVKWGAVTLAGTFGTLFFYFFPTITQAIQSRPTDSQVVAIIRDELSSFDIVKKTAK